MKNNVIIRKQKFSIRTGTEEIAFSVRKQVNDNLQFDLVRVYHDVFNSLSFSSKEHLYFNKICLDIGKCAEEDFIEKLPGLVKNALTDYLHSPLREAMPASSPGRIAGDPVPDHSEALLYYLETGIFPWWYTDSLAPRPSAIFSVLSQQEKQAFLQELIALREVKPTTVGVAARKRFLHLIQGPLIGEVLDILIALQRDKEVRVQFNNWRMASAVSGLASLFSVSFEVVEKHFAAVLLTGDHLNAGETAVQLFREMVRDHGNAGQNVGGEDLPGELFAGLKQATKAIVAEYLKPTEEGAAGHADHPSKETAERAAEGIYISNAGLVIFHPFLQQLFGAIGLLDHSYRFVDEQAACKAVAILYYLQHSHADYEEHEVAFNKILCGLNIEHALPESILLTENDRKACDDLLNTVTRYWEALKSASVKAVQQTFITHKGKLSFKSDHWLLQVEQATEDILVQRLPWSISTIKLPWLKHMIYTEW